MKCVVDTNILNRLVDGALRPEDLPADSEFVATHVQVDELNRTSDVERRARLFLMFATTVNAVVCTESFVLDASRLGYAKLSDGILYTALKADLDVKNRGKANNVQDALIAEMAIVNGYMLLTADSHLAEVANKHGCSVRHLAT